MKLQTRFSCLLLFTPNLPWLWLSWTTVAAVSNISSFLGSKPKKEEMLDISWYCRTCVLWQLVLPKGRKPVTVSFSRNERTWFELSRGKQHQGVLLWKRAQHLLHFAAHTDSCVGKRKHWGLGHYRGTRGAFCTWHNQDQAHPKMKQRQTDESFTPCLQHFLHKSRISRVLC